MPTATLDDSAMPTMVRTMNTASSPAVAGMTGSSGEMLWP